MMGPADSTVLMASSAGYGFLCRLGDLVGKQKAGKAVLTLPEGALVLPPQRVEAPESDLLVAVSSAGRMLVFPVSELPALARGKGNKILSLPKASVVSGEEVLRGVVALPADGVLRVHAGARYLNMKTSDLDAYRGERARRGSVSREASSEWTGSSAFKAPLLHVPVLHAPLRRPLGPSRRRLGAATQAGRRRAKPGPGRPGLPRRWRPPLRLRAPPPRRRRASPHLQSPGFPVGPGLRA